MQFVAPMADFFLEKWLEGARLDLAKIENLRQVAAVPMVIINAPRSITNLYKLP
jgi:hypothetical protein